MNMASVNTFFLYISYTYTDSTSLDCNFAALNLYLDWNKLMKIHLKVALILETPHLCVYCLTSLSIASSDLERERLPSINFN